jgi:endonuclease YncB( thermonuclease family)
MVRAGLTALAMLAALGAESASAQYGVAPNTVYVPGYAAPYPQGYVSVPSQNFYGPYGQLAPAPLYGQQQYGVQNGAVPIGPSVANPGQLGQQNTLQSPANALQQARPQSAPGPAAASSVATAARSVRGMAIEGVASVVDGDTFFVDQQLVVLYGADAPEIEQVCWANGSAYRCGAKAKEELARLIDGKTVACIGQRQAGDAVASVCRIAVGDVAEQMVLSGYAVVPSELTKAYINPQEQAKNARRGVWAGSFEWPWDVRSKSSFVRVAR